jgi:integrase
MKLTQANLDRIKIPAGKSELIEFDETMPGFGLRIRANEKGEHRTFIAQYKIGAKHRRVTLGNVAKVSLEGARKEAKRIFGKVANGGDPAAEKTVARTGASRLLEGIVAAYLEAKRTGKKPLRPRTYAENERYLNHYWKPLHKLTVSAVTRATVAAQVREIAKAHGPVAANRARASLSAMFRWAIGEGLCNENPVTGVNKQSEADPRERTLDDAEAAAIWLAAPDNDYGRIVRLLLLTASRRDEIGSLQWSEIDLEARTITLPGARTKNHQEHTIPLTDAALMVLQSAPPRAGQAYVFGNGKGGFSGWSWAKTALDDAAKVEGWVLHDLRRTVRTGLGKLGVLPHVAEAILNHLPARLIRTYDRNQYAAEKRAALDMWANHLAVAVAQANGGNVTQLRGAKTPA